MIQKLLSIVFGANEEQKQVDYYRQFLRREAEIGGQLFGAMPAGRRREFFCLDKHTWVWHEEWSDAAGQPQAKTTRYDVRPTGILKAQANGTYHAISREEALNLIAAAKAYRQRVFGELYGLSV